MELDFAEKLVENFERGLLSRRQLVSRLTGLGAALALMGQTAIAREEAEEGTFRGQGAGSRCDQRQERASVTRFYIKHLGLKVTRDGGEDNCFLARATTSA